MPLTKFLRGWQSCKIFLQGLTINLILNYGDGDKDGDEDGDGDWDGDEDGDGDMAGDEDGDWDGQGSRNGTRETQRVQTNHI